MNNQEKARLIDQQESVQLQAEIERLKASLGKHADRILELHARLKVIQDAADHCLIDVCPTKTPAVYEALWGSDK